MTGYADLVGKRVYVYRNLNTGYFSVMHKGRVVGQFSHVFLKDVTLRVRPGGRAKVLQERRKNVHAFVIGVVVPESHPPDGIKVRYNPYKNETFVDDTGTPWLEAEQANLIGGNEVIVFK